MYVDTRVSRFAVSAFVLNQVVLLNGRHEVKRSPWSVPNAANLLVVPQP